MGSKAKISAEILPIILKDIKEEQTYIEPFCGGLNSLCTVKHKNIIANDINPFLIAMWQYLKTFKGQFLPLYIDKELYSVWRNYYNNEKRNGLNLDNNNFSSYAICGWVGFMASFNGRFYDGGYSGHDVKGRDYIKEQINNTLSQLHCLNNVQFQCGEYYDIKIPDNSIIYCDIPYKNTKQYNLSINFNYDKFYQWCHEMKAKGHKIFVSEYNMPEDFICVWQKEVTVSLNQKITKKPIEKLFTL